MIKVVSVQTMRQSDAETIKSGISGRELMRRAAEAIVDCAEWKPPVAVVCGSGNNAGDGYAAAAILWDKGIGCVLFLLEERFSEDGAYYYNLCRQKGIPSVFCDENTDFSGFGTVLDCIFGTGYKGGVRGLAKTVIEKINASGATVVSADINSGLNGDSGTGDVCVVSDLTVSIGNYKPGHFLNRAKDVIRKKTNADIGIGICGESYSLFEAEDAAELFVRPHASNKGDYGYVALIGGSLEYSGAAKLANLACSALRSGAGVVRLAVPASIAHGVLPYLLESTLFPLKDEGGHLVFDAAEIDKVLFHTRAAAIGMGIGKSPETAKLLSHLLTSYSETLVVDADGLNTFGEYGGDLPTRFLCRPIFTPHLKEFSRLSGLTVAEILLDPIKAAKDYAKAYGVVLLLKGPATIITDGERVFLTDRGCPGMATGGSGDVLSGIIAGIAGYCKDPLIAAAAGATLNGVAGELAEASLNAVSMLAGDTAAHIPDAVNAILGKHIS